MIRIVYDYKIPFVEKYFHNLGLLIPFDATRPNKFIVNQADVLFIRSNIKVNKDLIGNTSRLRIICTASSGLDHIDTSYAAERGIQIFNVKGTNKHAVADYVSAAFFSLATNEDYRQLRIGIIGYGNIGKEVYRRFSHLGFKCLVYESPNRKTTSSSVKLVDILQCDVISLHVPLISKGNNPTFHLLDKEKIDALKPGTIIINTARGGIVDENALLMRMRSKNDLKLAFDVWENEPNINVEFMQTCMISTPHIAGWSVTARKSAIKKLFYLTREYLRINTKNIKEKSYRKVLRKNRLHLYDSFNSKFKILKLIFQKCVALNQLTRIFKQEILSRVDTVNSYRKLQDQYVLRKQANEYLVNAENLHKHEHIYLKKFGVKLTKEKTCTRQVSCHLFIF